MAVYYEIVATKFDKTQVVLDTKPVRSEAKKRMKELDKTGYERVRIIFAITDC